MYVHIHIRWGLHASFGQTLCCLSDVLHMYLRLKQQTTDHLARNENFTYKQRFLFSGARRCNCAARSAYLLAQFALCLPVLSPHYPKQAKQMGSESLQVPVYTQFGQQKGLLQVTMTYHGQVGVG